MKKRFPKKNQFIMWDKERVLEDLAYYFFCKKVEEFPYNALIEQVKKTLVYINQDYNSDALLCEIRENSGLLQKSDDNHLFVHRTFYEYYVSCKMRRESQVDPEMNNTQSTTCKIRRDSQDAESHAVLTHTSEPRWEEPIRLYAAQLESIAEGTEFIRKLWEKDHALALRCYPDMDKVVEPELIKIC